MMRWEWFLSNYYINTEWRFRFYQVDADDQWYRYRLHQGLFPQIDSVKSHAGTPYYLSIDHDDILNPAKIDGESRAAGVTNIEIEFTVPMDPEIATDPNYVRMVNSNRSQAPACLGYRSDANHVILIGNLNGDGMVNLFDFCIICAHWLETPM